MQPTCIAYAKQTIAYALHMQPRAIAYATQTFAYATQLLHMQTGYCICNPAIAYANQLFCICNPSGLHMQPTCFAYAAQ